MKAKTDTNLFLPQLLLASAILCTAFSCTIEGKDGEEENRSPPNIIMLLADDLGYGDLSCYGSSTIQTPNIDALAARGIRFTNFYSGSAVCSPSRAAMLTGRYPLRFDISRHFTGNQEHLPETATTIAELLRARDYRTIHIGKWHLGGMRPVDYEARTAGKVANPGPLQHGFDHALTCIEEASLRSKLIRTRRAYRDAGKYLVRNDQRVPNTPGHWTDLKVDEAIKEIGVAHKNDAPFYLNLWFDVPHTPYEPAPEPHLSKYAAMGAKGDQLYFRSMVSHLDANIGRLIDFLDKEGLTDNTLIVFTSDNGPSHQGSPGPFRGGKTDLHEGGLRVPMFAVWPKEIPEGQLTINAAHMVDLMPTFATISGADISGLEIDGIDVSPYFKDVKFRERAPLFWQMDLYKRYQNQGPKPEPYATEVVTDGRWKLLAYEGRTTELFDLVADQRELYNVVEKHPEEVQRLEKLLRGYLSEERDTSGYVEEGERGDSD